MGDEGTIAHVGFLNLTTWGDTDELGHQTIHHIGIILRLIGFLIRSQPQFHQFPVCDIVQSEEVGPRLLYRISVSLEGIRIYARQELSATMSQTLVEVGMQVVTDIPVFLDHPECLRINHELFLKTITMGGFIVGIGDITDGDALTAILGTDPVGIRQVDAYGRRRILISTQHGCTDDAGRHTLDHRFLKSYIYRRMVLKPLGILTDGSGPTGGFFIHILHQTFPRALQS